MIEIISNSYSYQDVFALLCSDEKGVGEKESGVFVDIGCYRSDITSNVKTLLDFGWTGIGFDINSDVLPSWENYKDKINVFICDVVEGIDTVNREISKLPDVIDYLNVDVDGYPCQYVIENLDLKNKVYRCITIEHDEYRFGDIYKNAQRNVLEPLGYEIVVKNAAEDFYVKPELISEEFLKTLRSIPKDYIQCDANLHEIRKYLNF
jgi:hypothetical protein